MTGKTGHQTVSARTGRMVDEVKVSGVVEVSATATVPEDATASEVRKALCRDVGAAALQAYISDNGGLSL